MPKAMSRALLVIGTAARQLLFTGYLWLTGVLGSRYNRFRVISGQSQQKQPPGRNRKNSASHRCAGDVTSNVTMTTDGAGGLRSKSRRAARQKWA